jgi:hypothetical protein
MGTLGVFAVLYSQRGLADNVVAGMLSLLCDFCSLLLGFVHEREAHVGYWY